MFFLIYGMVLLGSVLMVNNIIVYISYLRRILAKGYWTEKRFMLYFPLVLLIMFLVGYVAVGIVGKPDIIMSGILFFGSVYVTIILAVLRSITSRVEESEQLRAELRTAEESSRAKSSFLSRMSHEIRTPMNAIIGLNTLALKDPEISPGTRENLEKMDMSAHHMLDLINDILDMSRIEAGHTQFKWEPFLFHDLVEQVNGIIRSQCDDKGLTYEFETSGPMEPVYSGDMVKLKQMLINLLGNSVKFTPEGGTVRLLIHAGAPDGDQRPLKFIVQDTGIGMDPAFLPHLFDSFSQEDDTATSQFGGTGLGMAITKSIVDLAEGTISVDSEKGKGTTFTIDMNLKASGEMPSGSQDYSASAGVTPVSAGVAPVSDDEADRKGLQGQQTASGTPQAGLQGQQTAPGTPQVGEQGQQPAAQTSPQAVQALQPAQQTSGAEPVSLEGRRILFAEDVEINGEILADLLDMEDMESDWAKNGQEAVDMFAASEPGTYDAILMDLRMPVMDGLSAARAIRALPREDASEIPIIALTANAFSEDIRQCLEAGMNDHQSKPVDPDQLYDKLRKLIRP